MPLLEQVRKDLTEAMKARSTEKTQALRMLISALQKEATSSQPAEDLVVLRRLIGQSREAEEAFRKGGAGERAETEKFQAEVFKAYLPAQLGDEELEAMTEEAIRETGATSIKQMGQVIKAVQTRAEGRADNSRIAAAVKRKLNG
jgi:uncharacterized protein YqeY